MLVGLYAVSALFSYFQGYVMSGVTAKVTFRMRNEISEKMHALPLSYYDKTTHGEVLSRITNDVDTISQTMNQSLSQIITSVTSLVGITVMMFTISWQLTLTALIIIPLSMAAVIAIVRRSQGHFKNQQKFLGNVNGHVEEMFSNHVVVKAFCGEEDSAETFDQYNNLLYKSAWKAHFLSGLMMPITGFIGNLAYVAICILGGYYAVHGAMTVGGIQSFIQYIRSFTQPIFQIANISNVLQQTAAAAERVFEFLDEEEEVAEAEDALSVRRDETKPTKRNVVSVKGRVSFDRVSFGYDPEKAVIHNFSATVEPGRRLPSSARPGRGKTTIVKLLIAVLRRQRRLDHGRRAMISGRSNGRKCATVRHGAAGYLALQRHGDGQHTLWPAGRVR
jgi:ATP-binding cassette subfamily B protein